MNDILVSIWMITYNHEKYIAQALDSIMIQKTNFSFEVIIGEDCSTDNTRRIVKEFVERYPKIIKPIYHNINVGALRNAFEYSYPKLKGKYIACLEGDDFWIDEYKLQKQVDFLEAHPDYGLVHSDSDLYYQRSGKFVQKSNKKSNFKIPDGDVFDFLITPTFPMFIKTATVVFRKDIAEKFFDYNIVVERNWKLSDLPLWLDIAKNSKIHYFDEVFATYRLSEESASRSKNPIKTHLFHLSVFDIYRYYCEKYNVSDDIVNIITIRFNRSMLADAYNTNDKLLAQQSVYNLKQLKMHLSLKEYLLYVCSQNSWIRFFVKLVIKIL